jgi:hypothetical protein
MPTPEIREAYQVNPALMQMCALMISGAHGEGPQAEDSVLASITAILEQRLVAINAALADKHSKSN